MLFDESYNIFSDLYSHLDNSNDETEFSAEYSIKHQQSEYFLPSEDSTETFPHASFTKKPPNKGQASFIHGFWYVQNEVTFLFPESDLVKFPEDRLTISPQQWKVIKLCGRPIGFNETGVVSAMSGIDPTFPSLNISTAQTNCTLVPQELISVTAKDLSTVLNCPINYTPFI